MTTKRKFIEDANARGITDPAIIESKSKQYIEKYGDFEKEEKVVPKTPDQLKTLINKEKRKVYQDMGFGERMLAGAGKTAYSTAYAPVQKFLLGKGKEVDEIGQEYSIASKDDIASRLGEVSADMAMLFTPTGLATKGIKYGNKLIERGLKGLAGGAVGAGVHEAQRQSMGEGAGPGEALGEIAISTAIPMGAGTLAQYFKKTAPGILQSALKPSKQYSRKMNKPQFKVPLEEGLATNFGGVDALVKNVQKKVSEVGNVFENVISQSNINVNHDKVLLETQKNLSKQLNKKGFGVKELEEALSYAPEAIKNATYEAGSIGDGPLLLKGLEALKLQRSAGPKGSWSAYSADVKTPSEAKFWEAYNRSLSKNMDEAIEGQKGSKNLINEYRIAKKELAKLTPISKVAKDASDRISNNFKPGLLDINAGGVGANLAGGMGAGVAMGARRSLSTIGGANMMYGAGKLLEKESPFMGQLLRSSAFNE